VSEAQILQVNVIVEIPELEFKDVIVVKVEDT
jgi:hypothetical protein